MKYYQIICLYCWKDTFDFFSSAIETEGIDCKHCGSDNTNILSTDMKAIKNLLRNMDLKWTILG